jgi:catechol 2,3-dioxygenase-like lactoylglutathione lyase family enzyme
MVMSGLNTARVEAAVAVSDLPRARAFYEGQLGLESATPDEGGVRYECGEGTRIFIYETPENAGKSPATIAGFSVADLDATMADLRTRGISFEHYDQPGLVTDETGVFAGPGFRAAWLRDPDGNTLAITETADQA